MIRAVFEKGYDTTIAYGLYQYDRGQTLRVEGLELPDTVEVHFSIRLAGGDAPRRLGTMRDGALEVEIPDVMLENEGACHKYYIYAFIYLTNDDSGETIKCIKMQVEARPKPADWMPPDEPDFGQQLIAAVAAEREAAKGYADTAKSYTDTAQQYSDSAAKHAQSAQEAGEAAESVRGNVADLTEGFDGHVAAETAKAVQAVADKAAEYTASVDADIRTIQAAGAEQADVVNAAGTAQTDAINTAGTTQKQAIETAGAKQVENVNAAGTEQREAIATEGEAQTEAVDTAGATQIEAVNAAGTAQVDAVNAAGTTQIAEIRSTAADITPAIKCTAAGMDINIRDASGAPLSGMRVYGKTSQFTTTGKNLFDPEKYVDIALAANKGCEVVTFDGRRCLHIPTNLHAPTTPVFENSIPNARYTLSFSLFAITSPVGAIGNGFTLKYVDGTYTYAITPADVETNVWKRIRGTTTKELKNIYPTYGLSHECYIDLDSIQLEIGTTPTDYEPYTGGKSSPSPEYPQEMVSVGDGGSIEVAVRGKNLLGGRYYHGRYSSGIFYIENLKEVKFPYSPNAEPVGVCKIFNCKKGVSYTLSVGDPNTNYAIEISEYENFDAAFSRGNTIGYTAPTSRKSLKYTAKNDGVLVCGIAGRWTDGSTALHECTETELLQLEIGEQATPYEPYTAQTITHATPNGLRGIPVSSGGNYTDADGQQWICDDIDLGRGVYVQRIGCKTITGNATYDIGDNSFYVKLDDARRFYGAAGKRVMCDKFITNDNLYSSLGTGECCLYNHGSAYPGRNWIYFCLDGISDSAAANQFLADNPVTIMYELAAPIETPIPPEELAAYHALHTNHSVTNITNDAGAHMDVVYTADTDTYINNNYVPKATYEALEARVAALERHAISV